MSLILSFVFDVFPAVVYAQIVSYWGSYILRMYSQVDVSFFLIFLQVCFSLFFDMQLLVLHSFFVHKSSCIYCMTSLPIVVLCWSAVVHVLWLFYVRAVLRLGGLTHPSLVFLSVVVCSWVSSYILLQWCQGILFLQCLGWFWILAERSCHCFLFFFLFFPFTNNFIEGEVLLDWNSVCKLNSQK